MNLNKLQESSNEMAQTSEFSLDDIYFKDCFTKTEDKINMEVNNASVDCITSNKNAFSVDEEGNLLMKSIASDTGKFGTDGNGNFKVNSLVSNNGKFSIDEEGNLKAANINGASIQFDESEFLNKIYPIGSILFNTSNTNPNSYLGIGEWVAWGSGKVPVGVDTEQEEFNEIEKTGGEKKHTLSIAEMPAHKHTPAVVNENNAYATYQDGGGNGNVESYVFTKTERGHYNHFSTASTGESSSHNNLQPYITCYMWKRMS